MMPQLLGTENKYSNTHTHTCMHAHTQEVLSLLGEVEKRSEGSADGGSAADGGGSAAGGGGSAAGGGGSAAGGGGGKDAGQQARTAEALQTVNKMKSIAPLIPDLVSKQTYII